MDQYAQCYGIDIFLRYAMSFFQRRETIAGAEPAEDIERFVDESPATQKTKDHKEL